MCVMSMVSDHYNEKWNKPNYIDLLKTFDPINVSRSEFEHLKKEVEEMKDLLKRAKEYDEKKQ